MSLPVDNEVHELKLGSSFDSHSNIGFHSIRYDFKPASVDTNKEACVEVGEGNQVTITVPHVEGAGINQTVFKGNKQPLMKECVLVIDNITGVYTLEKLTSKITVKKTRADGSSKALQSLPGRVTPVDKKPARSKGKANQKSSPDMDNRSVTPTAGQSEASKAADDVALIGEISDSSDDDTETAKQVPPKLVPQKDGSQKTVQTSLSSSRSQAKRFDVLDDDLALSESGSDSD